MNSTALALLFTLLLVAIAPQLGAQAGATQHPRRADVESIDGIIRAFYEVVSVPAGVLPDRERDASLHAPGAQIRFSARGADGTPSIELLTLDEMYAKYYQSPGSRPFFEREIHRVTQRFGNIAHVWSTYEMREGPGGAPLARGISSIHLYHDGDRWWITGWSDEKESPAQPIPAEYLP